MDKNIVIVAGSFHREKVEIMVKEARRVAKKSELNILKEIWVPGSLEKPLALKRALSLDNVLGAAVLGIIEKGETKHGLVMGMTVFSAIINLQLEFNKPIGVGIVGPDVLPNQIPARLKPHARVAVLAVKAMLELKI